MTQMIPPINTRGFYELKAPFSTANNTIYECIAIREFKDYTQIGADVFGEVYAARGLDRAVYEADVAANVKIITLRSEYYPALYVPTSYINRFPSNDNVAYSHVVMSASLGPLPDTLDLTFLLDQIRGVVSSVIGVAEPMVAVHAAPSDQYISASQHATLEQARQAAISSMTTDRAQLLTERQMNDQLRGVIANYEAIMRAHGLLPE